MGAWADVIKVLRSVVFKNELKNGEFSVSKAEKATSADKATKISSLGAAVDNVARPVWFSDSEDSGLPRRDDDFTYNPSTNTLIVEKVKTGETFKDVSFPVEYRGVAVLVTAPSGKKGTDVYKVQVVTSNGAVLGECLVADGSGEKNIQIQTTEYKKNSKIAEFRDYSLILHAANGTNFGMELSYCSILQLSWENGSGIRPALAYALDVNSSNPGSTGNVYLRYWFK